MSESIITQVARDEDRGSVASAGAPASARPPPPESDQGGSQNPPKRKGFSCFPCWSGGGQGGGRGKNSRHGAANGGYAGAGGSAGAEGSLLGPLLPEDVGKKCLVLDLDETLVHSSFTAVPNSDFVVPVEVENKIHQVYVLKRPGVDQFMKRVGEQFEVVVFTASIAKYADPVLDLLDKHKVVRHRLFRDACHNHHGNYVKDLRRLGRELKDVIIIDNSPTSYLFQPDHAVPVGSWFDNPDDTELLDLLPFLEAMTQVDDVRTVLDDSR